MLATAGVFSRVVLLLSFGLGRVSDRGNSTGPVLAEGQGPATKVTPYRQKGEMAMLGSGRGARDAQEDGRFRHSEIVGVSERARARSLPRLFANDFD